MVRNGNGPRLIPMPADFATGRDGRILFARQDSDYRMRAEPADVLSALERVAGLA